MNVVHTQRINLYLLPVGEETLLCALIQQGYCGKCFHVFQNIIVCKDDVAYVLWRRKYQKTRCNEKQHGCQLTISAASSAFLCCLKLLYFIRNQVTNDTIKEIEKKGTTVLKPRMSLDQEPTYCLSKILKHPKNSIKN